MRAALAGCFAFLEEPAASGADAAGRQGGFDCGHELDEAGRPILGWCFLPKGCLVAGDVMLAQKIALETSEVDALKVALRFRPSERMFTTQRLPLRTSQQ